MAEAAVEERPLPSRYYCHMCSVEFEQLSQGYTCPHCSGGFIEELAPAPEVGVDESDDGDLDADPVFDFLYHRIGELSSMLPTPSDGEGSGAQTNRQGRRAPRNRQSLPIENVLQEFIVNLTSGSWGAPGTTTTTTGPMMFLGNPGDYAWGREGLDSIVTQLLNQMDNNGTGPPPLSTEQISSIPVVEISLDQTTSKLQCSVCWEDFKEQESVRQLPCTHVYHEACILPWLQLHATCPICRKSLLTSGEEASRANQHLSDMFHTFGSRIPLRGTDMDGQSENILAVMERNNLARNNTTEAPAPATTQSSDSNVPANRGPMRDYNMDLEFD